MEYNVLNVFTDASLRKNPDGTTDTCAGFIPIEMHQLGNICNAKILDVTGIPNRLVMHNTTNNQGEATAVFMGLDYIWLVAENYDIINLISDSQWCVYSLTRWMYSWVKTENNGIWFTSSGEEVKNLNIFYNIINTVLMINRKINLYHIVGHTQMSNAKAVEKAYNKFINFNNIPNVNIDMSTFQNLLAGNDYVDEATRAALYDTPSILDKICGPIVKFDDFKQVMPIFPNCIPSKLVYKCIRMLTPDTANVKFA